MGGGLVVTRPAPMLQHIDMGMLVLVLLLLRRGTLLPSWLPRSEARACTTASRCRLFASNEAKYAFHQAIQCGERAEPASGSSTARARSPTRSDDSALPLYESLPSAPAMRIRCAPLPCAKVPAMLLPEIHLRSNYLLLDLCLPIFQP